MTATYDPTQIDPSASGQQVSAVRWLIQDIDEATAEVQDEEITALYTRQHADVPQLVKVYRVAAETAKALERRYRKLASYSSGGTSVQLTQRAEAWAVSAEELQALAVAAEAAETGTDPSVLEAIAPRRDSQFPSWDTTGLPTRLDVL